MNLRFINRNLPVHPRTGLQAIGYSKRGVIWPVMGGSEEETTEETSTEEETTEEEEKETAPTYSKEEYDKLLARMKAADRRADENAKRLKAIEEKDLPDVEKTKRELEESKTFAAKVKEKLDKLTIQNAFLRSNEITWYDPEDALTMADLSGVEIGEDGTVDAKALKAALKDLAKRKPHLVKKAKETEEEEEETPKPSGSKITGKHKKETPTREDLSKKFPALRRR